MPTANILPKSGSSRDYRLLEPIGSGAFGVVYRAELRCAAAFSRVVAVKVLHPSLAGDAARLEKLRAEARVLGSLRHRAIVTVLGVVDVEGKPAIAMEHVPGADLSDLLALGAMPAAAAVELAGEVASALDTAWFTPDEAGQPLRVVHRDLTTANIRVTPSGGVKVLDFGLARDAGQLAAGTVAICRAPGATHGEGPSSDIYALGMILFQALTGAGFGAPGPSAAEHYSRHRSAMLRLWESCGSEGLVRLVGDMLSWDPAARPTAREVERRCTSLVRAVSGTALRDWAESAINTLPSRTPPGGAGPLPPGSLPPAPLARRPKAHPALLVIGLAAMGAAFSATMVVGTLVLLCLR